MPRVTGDPAAIAATLKAYRSTQEVPLEGGDYTMDHTAILLMIRRGFVAPLISSASRRTSSRSAPYLCARGVACNGTVCGVLIAVANGIGALWPLRAELGAGPRAVTEARPRACTSRSGPPAGRPADLTPIGIIRFSRDTTAFNYLGADGNPAGFNVASRRIDLRGDQDNCTIRPGATTPCSMPCWKIAAMP